MTKRNRFKLRKAEKVEYYYLIVDRDFQRPICAYPTGSYYFCGNPEKATQWLTREEAENFIANVKTDKSNNPFVIVKIIS